MNNCPKCNSETEFGYCSTCLQQYDTFAKPDFPKSKTTKEHERNMDLGTYTRNRFLDSNNCPKCGQPVGSWFVHTKSVCDRYLDRRHKIEEASKNVLKEFAGAFQQLAENDKMTNSYNDEELARVFYTVAKKFGVPTLKCDDRGDFQGFEDLSLREIKAMAQFVRELRK